RDLMRSIDGRAVKAFGLRGLQLMENAGRGVADVVLKELKANPANCNRVAVVAGKGSNGGDGFVCARHLQNKGIPVTVFSLAKLDELSGDAAINAAVWLKSGNEFLTILGNKNLRKHVLALRHSSIIIDALLGTGISSPVKGIYADVIATINKLGKKVISIDMPSGIDATTGKVLGCAVKADITATMAMPKLGLFSFPGYFYAGRVEVIDIGVPRSVIDDASIRWNITTGPDVSAILKPRAVESHKGSCGHLFVLAGSPGKTGAAYMCATAAMRSGAGLVTIGLPESLNDIMEVKTTEVMTLSLPESVDSKLCKASIEYIISEMEGKSAMLIGPGLGASDAMYDVVREVILSASAPLVIDADGLNALKGRFDALKKAKAGVVLTPHPGEAGRLLGVSAKAVQDDRVGSAEKLSKLTGAVVLLKGALTVIAAPDGRVYINPTGNAGLASAGTGDVLSGMVAGLIAQGYGLTASAVVAAYVHGAAADRLKQEAGEVGMMATDLLAVIPRVLNSLTGTAL
ncbi:NAD(P)H-hydrate dehydratase, partial [bacterium]